jgi:hypothetical protein
MYERAKGSGSNPKQRCSQIDRDSIGAQPCCWLVGDNIQQRVNFCNGRRARTGVHYQLLRTTKREPMILGSLFYCTRCWMLSPTSQQQGITKILRALPLPLVSTLIRIPGNFLFRQIGHIRALIDTLRRY